MPKNHVFLKTTEPHLAWHVIKHTSDGAAVGVPAKEVEWQDCMTVYGALAVSGQAKLAERRDWMLP